MGIQKAQIRHHHYGISQQVELSGEIYAKHVRPADGTGLYSTLRSLHESIKYTTTEGAALRNLYADFLDEAAEVLGHPALTDAATQYRHAAAIWATLADSAMPDNLPPLQQTKQLLADKYATWREQGQKGMAKINSLNDQLLEIEMKLNPGMSFNQDEKGALFSDMQSHLLALHDAEKTALNTLSKIVG